MSMARKLSKFLPAGRREQLRQKWHRWQADRRYFQSGGTFSHDVILQCDIAEKTISVNGRSLRVSGTVRSERERKRWIGFAEDKNDFCVDWYGQLSTKSMLWDIGSANGLEGFLAWQASGCKVVFFEPFTPSIESILKTGSWLARKYGRDTLFGASGDIEVVQAGVAPVSKYDRIETHGLPVAGTTNNSLADSKDLYCYGGRQGVKSSVCQWLPFVALDDMVALHGFSLPTHMKIDVDGLELGVLEGAVDILKSGSIESLVVEVNGRNREKVPEFLERYGYHKTNEYRHITGEFYTADYLFER